VPGVLQAITGEAEDGLMALPVDQVIRERKFLAANPQWTIYSQDKGRRFTAECDDPNYVVVAMSLKELLDRLETIASQAA
jgi:hypothetical protein